MQDPELQSVAPADLSSGAPLGKTLLALNNAHAAQLSWLEPQRLQYLVKHAFLARRIGNLDAFLLALDQDAAYDSPNFQWFCARYPRFVYVDRRAPFRFRGCSRACRGCAARESAWPSRPKFSPLNRASV